jgi:hypothetical protein
MNTIVVALFGWLVPGGAYLLMRKYLQFAIFATVVTMAVVAGCVLQGGAGWPQPEELTGLDGFSALLFKAGALAKYLAGVPYLAASLVGSMGGFLSGRAHEYGNVLLVLAGVLNALAVSSALDLKKVGVK